MKVYRAVQLRFAHFYAGIFHFNKMDIENYTRIYIICVLSIYTHTYIYTSSAAPSLKGTRCRQRMGIHCKPHSSFYP